MMSFLTGLAAFNSANNVLFVALALQLSVVLLNGLISWWNFSRIAVKQILAFPCRAREEGQLLLMFEDRKRRFPSLGLTAVFELTDPSGAVTILDFPIVTTREGRESKPLEYRWSPVMRGLHRVSFRHIESSFPFGFIVKTYPFPAISDVLAWPGKSRSVPSNQTGAGVAGMELLARRREGFDEIHGLRDYRRGDPLSSIHWKKSTRSGTMVVKLRSDGLNRGAVLVFDLQVGEDCPAETWEHYLEQIADLTLFHLKSGTGLRVSLHGAPFLVLKTEHFPKPWFDQLALAVPATVPLDAEVASGRSGVSIIRMGDLLAGSVMKEHPST
jgi:uncharacterized protein (DUF58 family)